MLATCVKTLYTLIIYWGLTLHENQELINLKKKKKI